MQWRRADGSDEWAVRLGPERAGRAFRTADLRAAGALIPLGSDWPVAQADPRIGLAWAQLRRAPGAVGDTPWEPSQRLDGIAALEGYTTSAAAVIGEQSTSGRIAPGFHADLTGFAADPVSTDPDDLPSLPIRLTIVAGRVVHQA
jgi:hypothetical protein